MGRRRGSERRRPPGRPRSMASVPRRRRPSTNSKSGSTTPRTSTPTSLETRWRTSTATTERRTRSCKDLERIRSSLLQAGPGLGAPLFICSRRKERGGASVCHHRRRVFKERERGEERLRSLAEEARERDTNLHRPRQGVRAEEDPPD